MSDILAVIMNKRRLRAAISELTLNQLESLSAIFDDVLGTLKKDYLAIQQEKEAHQQRLQDAMHKLTEMGISESDLMQYLGYQVPQPEKKVRQQRKEGTEQHKARGLTKKGKQYHYVNSKGEPDVWYGVGRMPVVIRTAIFNGTKTLEDFLVKQDEAAEAV